MTASRDRIASGTAFRTPCATRSTSCHLRNRRCRRASWRCASPTTRAIFISGFNLPAAEGARDEGLQSLRHATA
jgi:hypothetical protein